MWTLRQVEVVPVVVGALGAVPKKLKGFLEKIGIVIPVEVLQKTSLLGSARIHKSVLDIKEA